MKSKTKVKMVLMKLDPPPQKKKENKIDKEETLKGITSNMKSKTTVKMMLMKLDPPPRKKKAE